MVALVKILYDFRLNFVELLFTINYSGNANFPKLIKSLLIFKLLACLKF